MEKPKINYQEIDAGIRDLVRLLNEVPFLATESSCEGHLKYNIGPAYAYPGHAFIDSGHIMFWLDNSYTSTELFLHDLTHLVKQYDFLDLREHHCYKGKDCSIDGIKHLDLGHLDLTHVDTIKDSDTLETMIKKRRQVPEHVGEKRIAEYAQVWHELAEIARRYAPNPAPV